MVARGVTMRDKHLNIPEVDDQVKEMEKPPLGYITEGLPEFIMTLFPKNFKGVCIDVGAFDPLWINNTYIFEQAGWEAYCIEPNPNCLPKLKQYRKNIIQLACGSENKDNVDFHIYRTPWAGYNEDNREVWDGEGAYTGLIKHEPSNGILQETIKVNVRTLDNILDYHNPPIKKVDYISIDVERNEMEVLRGFTMNWWLPKVIVIENEYKTADQHGWISSYGYRLINRITVNDIYLRTF